MTATHELTPGGLLHNMSAPPKSVVQYGGLSQLMQGLPGSVGSKRRTPASGALAVRFDLPGELSACSATEWLRLLGVKPQRGAPAQLEALIDVRARELPLPPGCAVIACQPAHRRIWTDPLSVLAILAKCSDTLWLRDKIPSLSSARARGRVSLLVPARFVQHLPKDAS